MEMNKDKYRITLYSKEDCPRCGVLEKKMNQLGLSYEKNTDVEKMTELGITDVPVLKVELTMDFKAANEWVNLFAY